MKNKILVMVIAVLVAAMLAVPVFAEKRVALVIGNGAYKTSTTLRNPPNDAVDVSAALKAAGFTVTTLVDAKRDAMEKAVRDFGNALKDPDIVGLFYYSGHGAQVDGANYLLPVDADIQAEDELAYKAVNAEQVLAKMRSAGNKLNIVVMDACRNNPFPGSTRSADKGLAVVRVKVPESIIVYATDPGAVAQDGDGRNSPFTKAFIEQLAVPGQEISVALRRVTGAVKDATGGVQSPWVSTNYTSDFVFRSGSASPATFTSSIAPSFGAVKAAKGNLSVQLASAGTVSVAGLSAAVPAGTVPVNDLPAGGQTVSVRYADGKSESQTVTVPAGGTASVVFTYCGAKQANVIKVGWFGPLTGNQAVWGNSEFNTVKMLFEEINAAGGVKVGDKTYTLEAIGYDNKGDAQEAVNVVHRLTSQDKVVAILGPNASGNAIPIAPILEAAKVPDIATYASNPKVTVLDGKVKQYNFRVCFIDPYQGAVAAGYAFDVLGARKAAILYDVSDDYSQGLRQFFVENFKKNGGTIVADESFKSGDVDFRPQLSKIKAQNPDIIFMPYFFKEVALSANQARELGMKQVLMGGDGWPSDQLIRMGGAAVEGSYIVSHLNYNDPDVLDYEARYFKKYGIPTEFNGSLVHDAVLMLVDALKRAGKPDGESIAKALESVDIKGITGNIKISPQTHNPEGKDAGIIKIVSGKFIFQQKYAAK